MQYRKYIQDHFLIDEPKSGKLVPFIFRDVQNKYYDELVRDYDIENKGLTTPIRDIILKARREGFSSLVLALFAADDLWSDNPTETLVISYRDDATQTFRKRYRLFITSCAAKKKGYTVEQIQQSPKILDDVAKEILSIDSTEFELKHNKAHFYCGTASARVGGRGGVVQKLLFSEAAFYPDKKEMRAKEIVEGTLRQVDLSSGWCFVESTANGDMNHYAKMWNDAEAKTSRFKGRFYGWREMYSEQEFELIKSEFTDKRMIPQEYPENPAEAFLSSGDRFFDPAISSNLKTDTPRIEANWRYYRDYEPGHRYSLGADISEGVGRHNSTIAVIDYDAKTKIEGQYITKPKVVALYASNKIPPDLFAHEIKNGGNRYGSCIVAPERNNHGFATLTILKDIYFNIYKDAQEKLGWHTNLASKPKMLHDLRTAIHEGLIDISDDVLRQEIISYPAIDLNTANVDEEDETTGHYDRVIACFIKGTMVLTDKGYQPIETIQVNDRVMTRKGYRRILKTSVKVDKVISNIGLTGTPNHPVICADGTIRDLSGVRNSDILYIWDSKQQRIEKLSYTEALPIIGIPKQNERTTESILREEQSGKHQESTFIGRFGLIISAIYRKVIQFITKTITQVITPLKTFVCYLQANILNIIIQTLIGGRRLGRFLTLKKIEKSKQLVIGRHLPRKKGENWNVLSVIKYFAQLPIMPSFVLGTAYLSTSAQRKESQKWIESVTFADKYSKRVFQIRKDVQKCAISYGEGNSTYQQVYNLEVEDVPEYFANGVLVHNCAIAWQMRSLAYPTQTFTVKDDYDQPMQKEDRYELFNSLP